MSNTDTKTETSIETQIMANLMHCLLHIDKAKHKDDAWKLKLFEKFEGLVWNVMRLVGELDGVDLIHSAELLVQGMLTKHEGMTEEQAYAIVGGWMRECMKPRIAEAGFNFSAN